MYGEYNCRWTGSEYPPQYRKWYRSVRNLFDNRLVSNPATDLTLIDPDLK
jgi:hypothetical protein